MLRSLHDLREYTISATDGEIGHVRDFYFDDAAWVVRYLIVDTGEWLGGRSVLISPMAIKHPTGSDHRLPVDITKDQVRQSPDIDTHRPVSRQLETDYTNYYGYENYWAGSGLWWGGIYPSGGYGYGGEGTAWIPAGQRRQMAASYEADLLRRHANDDIHLRSCDAVNGYYVHASDGDIGHVEGFLLDDDTWAIRFLVVNTSNWWLGHKVLIAPEWIDQISWADARVTLDVTRAAVQGSPPYSPTSGVAFERDQEPALFAHYQRHGFWKSAGERPHA